MFKYTLSSQEVYEVGTLVDEVVSRGFSTSENEFFDDATFYAQELPRGLRKFMKEMKYGEQAGVWIVSGFPVDDDAIGRTPPHWAPDSDSIKTQREEIAFTLFSTLLGDPFGWATQQNGAIIHNLLPIPGHEHEQLGTGSTDLLAWHTEEAFHPLRCDYLALMCLRNYDAVPTTFASLDMVKLDEKVCETLFEPRYIILPDTSHLASQNILGEEKINQDHLLSNAYQGIDKMVNEPDKVPILYGDKEAPYMAVDPVYMEIPKDDKKAKDALDVLSQAIDEQLQDIVLGPGECCYIDNYRSVHGRKPFSARYDGTDRWLKRLNITRDLRKSRASRAGSTSRVIY